MSNQILSLIPLIIYGLAILVFILGLALAFLSISYRKTLDRLSGLDEKEGKLLVKANIDALEIIKKAQAQASKIIESSSQVVKNNNSLLQSDIKSLSQTQLALYKQTLESLNQHVTEISKNISKDVVSATEEEFSTLRKTHTDQIKKAYEVVASDIENYRKEKMRELDSSTFALVKEVALLVLQKSLTQREHTQLVLRSLEEAKKKHVF